MIKIFVIFLFLMYLGIILKRFLRISDIAICLNALLDFLNSATLTSHSSLSKDSDCKEKLNIVLRIYPKISEFTNFYSPTLSYSYSDVENYKNSVRLYNELQMQKNFLIRDLKKSFNPLIAIKSTFSLPITLMQFLGIKPSLNFSNLINLAAWIIAFILNLYSVEIKALLNHLLKLL